MAGDLEQYQAVSSPQAQILSQNRAAQDVPLQGEDGRNKAGYFEQNTTLASSGARSSSQQRAARDARSQDEPLKIIDHRIDEEFEELKVRLFSIYMQVKTPSSCFLQYT